MSIYDIILYFNSIYAWAYLSGPGGTKIMGFNSYTLVNVGIRPFGRVEFLKVNIKHCRPFKTLVRKYSEYGEREANVNTMKL
jgi:hypothetical protein